jgi:hypothetical protein
LPAPDVTRVQYSDLAQIIRRRTSGPSNYTTPSRSLLPKRTTLNTCTVLRNREANARDTGRVSPSDHVQLMHRFVPTKMKGVNHYDARVFCSKFSQDGQGFMVASQDHHVRVYSTDRC